MPKTHGVLVPLEDGTLKECAVAAEQEAVEESDIASAIVTGNVDVCRDADFDNHDDGSIQFMFFKDPPCVLPFKATSDSLGLGDGDHQAFQYWKKHAAGLEQWPELAEARRRNLIIVNSLGDRGHHRCSAVAVFRILVNVSIEPVAILRRPPSEGDDVREDNDYVHSGELVIVRDTAFEQQGARWWTLRDKAGIICDSKDGTPTLLEAKNLETGRWWYRNCCSQCIEIRSAPTYCNEARSRWVMCPREVALVCARCRIAGSEFVQLADGRGWVFTMRPCFSDLLGITYAGQERVFEQCEDEFWELDARRDVWSALPPTEDIVEVGNWTYVVQERPVLCIGTKRHGTFLAPGDIVTVDKRAIANGDPFPGRTILNRFWVRLKDGRGWAPVLAEDGKEQLKVQGAHETLHPPWFKGRLEGSLDHAKEPWMVGVV